MTSSMYITATKASKAAKAVHDDNIEMLERIHHWREPKMVEKPFKHDSQEFKQIAKTHKGLSKPLRRLLEKTKENKRAQYRDSPFSSAALINQKSFWLKESTAFSISSVREDVSGDKFDRPGSYNALLYGPVSNRDQECTWMSDEETGIDIPLSIRTPDRTGYEVIDEIRKNYHNQRHSLFNDLYPRVPDDDSVNDSNVFNFIAMRMKHRMDKDQHPEPQDSVEPCATTIKSWNLKRKEAQDYWKANMGTASSKTPAKGNKRSREHDDTSPRGTAKRQRRQTDKTRTPLPVLPTKPGPLRERKIKASRQKSPAQNPKCGTAKRQLNKVTSNNTLSSLTAQDPSDRTPQNQYVTATNESAVPLSPAEGQGAIASPALSEALVSALGGVTSPSSAVYTPKHTRKELFDICNEKIKKHEAKEAALTTQEFQNEADKVRAIQSNTKALREYNRARTSCEAGTIADKPCTACVKLGWPCIIDTDRNGKKVDKCARCILQKLSGTHCQGDDAARAKLKQDKDVRSHGQARLKKETVKRGASAEEVEEAGGEHEQKEEES